jgi:hypothetical protein
MLEPLHSLYHSTSCIEHAAYGRTNETMLDVFRRL